MASIRASRTILIVDDEERLRRALGRTLRQEDCETCTAASGEEALDLLDQTKIDVVITDLVMPGMDGLTLVRAIKEAHPSVKVITITAYGSAESMEEAEALGVAYYMTKPFDLSDLKSKVNELLPAGEITEAARAEPGIARVPRSLRVLCSGAGKSVGAVAGLSRRAFRRVQFREAPAAAGMVRGVATGFRSSIQGFVSVFKSWFGVRENEVNGE